MSYLEEIKSEITQRTHPCTHSNESAGWFSRAESNGTFAIYQFDKNADLKCKHYKTLNSFARAIMNRTNRG